MKIKILPKLIHRYVGHEKFGRTVAVWDKRRVAFLALFLGYRCDNALEGESSTDSMPRVFGRCGVKFLKCRSYHTGAVELARQTQLAKQE